MSSKQGIPKVAIITRTKNRGVLLERAIKSIHQQTMPDFVHVIINDAGDQKIVDELVEKYKDIIRGRVKVIHNAESHGMEAASNKAIKSVDSTYVAIHDDDDSWHPDFLKETTERLESTGANGAVVLTDRIEENITGSSVQEYARERWLPHLRSLSLYDLCLDNFAVPISFIFSRAVFKETGYYDESLRVCGDWDFAFRFMRKYEIEFLNNNRVLAFYHQRPRAAGPVGNSVFAGADMHEKYRTILANKLLREDLENGGLGIGYLFSERRFHREEAHDQFGTEQKLLQHIDKLEQTILARTDYRGKIMKFTQKIPGIRSARKILR